MTNQSILPTAWQVPQVFRDRLGATVGRQRPMEADGNLLLVLHAPPKHHDHERIGRFFWRDADSEWRSKEFGSGVSALNKHLDEYEDVIAQLDLQEEKAKSAEDYFELLEQLSPIYRAARNQHQVLQDARKLCPDFLDLIDLRDKAYTIERTAELLFTGTQNALEFAVARRAEDQARASQRMEAAAHRLNILVAFFFPIVTLTAILGIDMATLAAIFGLDAGTVLADGQALLAVLGLVLIGLVLGVILTAIINRSPAATSGRDPTERR